MSATEICEAVSSGLGELYTCARVGEYTRIRTPFLYPDGDVIDVFVQERDGATLFTDLGETLRWLRMQSISDKRTPRQRKFLDDLSLDYGVELFRGMFRLYANRPEEFASSLSRVIQTSLRASDLWLTFRTRLPNNSTDDIAELLDARHVPFVRDKKLTGRSGRTWNLDFQTSMERHDSLIHVLSTGSRATAHSYAEHVFASFYDLSQLTMSSRPTKFVSVFDDTIDVWQPEDLRLVAEISDIAFFSKPEALYELVAA